MIISVSGKKWQEKKVNSQLLEKIQQDYNFSKILSKLIISRKFDEYEIHLIEKDLKLSNVFYNNPDFINSIKLLEKTIKNKENICILGDYDVDGSISTSLFVNLFKSLNHPFFYYIPDRVIDGYGASKKLFEKLILKKPKLVIMVDCGSTSVDAINYLSKNNIKSLIIDHHEINKPYPKANVIINPKKNNGYIEYDYLCATTLSYFFLEMFIKKNRYKVDLKKYLIYVLLATVADVMPLRKFNRLIAIKALKEFKIQNNYVLNEMYKLSNKKNKININDLGYLIAPILNAGGRLGKSNHATQLLTADDNQIVKKKLSELINLNEKRKKIEAVILENIDFRKIKKENENVIIYYDPNIDEGLIGIIAARLKDFFNKPSIVITRSNSFLKGSARSTNNYNIGKVIKNLSDKKIILNGGGHNMAGGFTLKKENLTSLKNYMNKFFLKNNDVKNDLFEYDAEISSIGFNKNFYNEIKKIEPFGNGNPSPIFLLNKLKVIKIMKSNKKHISCILKSKIGFSINSISFNSLNTDIGYNLLNNKNYFAVIGQINENFWNNKKSLQLVIKDLIL
ncbi:MAG: single-stranded-DNA-specific exonuclease RecJ [Candidatus Pelagibacter sp.]